jgi:tungstate transport system ATP-binding protein
MYKLENVSKVYDGKPALEIKSMDIEKGKIYTILGPSGAGKSTLLRLLNFLEPPTTGKIYFLDKAYNGNTLGIESMRKITTVFQKPALLDSTVWKNVVFPLKIRGVRIDIPKVETLLKDLKILDLKNRRVKKLSGGEAQRVALARALVFNPEVLLLDEATANLDSGNIAIIERMVKKYVQNTNATVIMVTHNLFQAKRMADEAALFFEGKLIEYGQGDNFFNNPKEKLTLDFLEGRIIF